MQVYGMRWRTPRGGCESESAGRADAEDRSTPEETQLDIGRSGEPLRRDAATDQRSAARPGLALLARRTGQHRDGAGLAACASISMLPEPWSSLRRPPRVARFSGPSHGLCPDHG